LDCASTKPSKNIRLEVDYCLWGDYYLVNNFKITKSPTCDNGRAPVLSLYPSTSCTGNPSFSTNAIQETFEGQCLFGSSSEKWSLIFRCEKIESQAVAKHKYMQAIPPSYTKKVLPGRIPVDGVVTPFYSYDCTINQPKEPTHLPADTCLTLEVGHSIFVSQPLICQDGRVALAQASYSDTGCTESLTTPFSWLGNDVFQDEYYNSVDKKCHTMNARSFAFICGGNMTKFEKLPPYTPQPVEQLLILPLPAPPRTPVKLMT
jgi:hypothetical protein